MGPSSRPGVSDPDPRGNPVRSGLPPPPQRRAGNCPPAFSLRCCQCHQVLGVGFVGFSRRCGLGPESFCLSQTMEDWALKASRSMPLNRKLTPTSTAVTDKLTSELHRPGSRRRQQGESGRWPVPSPDPACCGLAATATMATSPRSQRPPRSPKAAKLPWESPHCQGRHGNWLINPRRR